MNRRALLIVLDSVGIGNAPDAADYGDNGANTLGHILDRFPNLQLPTLWSLGLGQIINRGPRAHPRASFGIMREKSVGKDSTTGHWELAGVLLDQPFGLFDHFPPELVGAIEREARVDVGVQVRERLLNRRRGATRGGVRNVLHRGPPARLVSLVGVPQAV